MVQRSEPYPLEATAREFLAEDLQINRNLVRAAVITCKRPANENPEWAVNVEFSDYEMTEWCFKKRGRLRDLNNADSHLNRQERFVRNYVPFSIFSHWKEVKKESDKIYWDDEKKQKSGWITRINFEPSKKRIALYKRKREDLTWTFVDTSHIDVPLYSTEARERAEPKGREVRGTISDAAKKKAEERLAARAANSQTGN